VRSIEVIRGGVGLVAGLGFVRSGLVARPLVARMDVATVAVPMPRVMRLAPKGVEGVGP
jgi:hypothetical protein